MAIRPTHKCHTCKEVFKNEEMINYATPRAKTSYWYCKKCYEKKIWREKFIDKICIIFGVKAPGSKVWKQRERLQENYGYSDEVLINCLDYIYNVEKFKILNPTLGLITPAMVDKMMRYKRQEKHKSLNLAAALQTEVREHIVPIKENIGGRKKVSYDPDEWLDD